MFLQPIQGFSISYKGFSTISRVFNLISRVFSIVNKVVAPRSNLVGTGALSTGYKVLQSTNQLCVGSKALDVRVLGSSILVHCNRDLVASMTTCGATASPCWHQWKFQSTVPSSQPYEFNGKLRTKQELISNFN